MALGVESLRPCGTAFSNGVAVLQAEFRQLCLTCLRARNQQQRPLTRCACQTGLRYLHMILPCVESCSQVQIEAES
jgi:hypothetical protein